jgi:hypothetical protein
MPDTAAAQATPEQERNDARVRRAILLARNITTQLLRRNAETQLAQLEREHVNACAEYKARVEALCVHTNIVNQQLRERITERRTTEAKLKRLKQESDQIAKLLSQDPAQPT